MRVEKPHEPDAVLITNGKKTLPQANKVDFRESGVKKQILPIFAKV